MYNGEEVSKVTGYLVSKLPSFLPDKTPEVQDAPCSYQGICTDLVTCLCNNSSSSVKIQGEFW
jgi:hypothetical protein